jgi:hypothetical protein
MFPWPLLLLLASAPTSARAQDPVVPAFIEVLSAADEYFLHQTIALQLRFGIEREFFEQQLIPLFRRELDLPVQIDAGFLLDHRAAQIPPGSAGRQSLVLNGGLQYAETLPDRLIDGRAYRMVQLQYQLRGERAGALRIAPAELRLAYATAFQEDLVQGRVPESRLLATVASDAFSLKIKALPLVDVPADFLGAVGQFSMDLSADPGLLQLGQAFSLRLDLSSPLGHSNLVDIEPPDLNGLEGFHQLGRIELPAEDPSLARSWRYELAVSLASILSLPAQRFSYFDPSGLGAYRTLSSGPIPLQVAVASEPKVPVAVTPVEQNSDGMDFSSILVFLALFPWLLVFGLWLGWRSRRRQPERNAGAPKPVRNPVQDNQEEGLLEFLTQALHCSNSAIICPALAQRLMQAGVSEDLALQAAATMESLTATRYGGPELGPTQAELSKLRSALRQELSA